MRATTTEHVAPALALPGGGEGVITLPQDLPFCIGPFQKRAQLADTPCPLGPRLCRLGLRLFALFRLASDFRPVTALRQQPGKRRHTRIVGALAAELRHQYGGRIEAAAAAHRAEQRAQHWVPGGGWRGARVARQRHRRARP
ncbi:MAG: hypothetical protein ACREFP_09565 [Acetobacteraceae bacterium]